RHGPHDAGARLCAPSTSRSRSGLGAALGYSDAPRYAKLLRLVLWTQPRSVTLAERGCVRGAPAAAGPDLGPLSVIRTRLVMPSCCGWSFGHRRAPSRWRSAAVCAEHQPQRVRTWGRSRLFARVSLCQAAAAGPLDTAALRGKIGRSPGHMES